MHHTSKPFKTRFPPLHSGPDLSTQAYQYDAVCNGFEIASGSIRNQSPELMQNLLELLCERVRQGKPVLFSSLTDDPSASGVATFIEERLCARV